MYCLIHGLFSTESNSSSLKININKSKIHHVCYSEKDKKVGLLENTHEGIWELPPCCSSCHPPNTRLSLDCQGRGGTHDYNGSSPGCRQCTCWRGRCCCPQPGGFHMRQLQGDTQRSVADPLFKVWFMVVLCKRCTIKRRKLQLICICCTVCADSSQSRKPILNTAKLPETMLFVGIQIQLPSPWNL